MDRTREKSRKIQFQLGWGGLIALTISTICVFMWIFILGFWVGQKLVGHSLNESISTHVVTKAVPEQPEKAIPLGEKESEVSTPPTPVIQTAVKDAAPQETELSVKSVNKVEQPQQKEKSIKEKVPYFVLQIASYKEQARANKEAARWRDMGYRAKVRKADLGPRKGIWYRVHLGEYRSEEDAKNFACKLGQKYDLKSYIVPINE
jgi:cell division protein FtsN